MLKKGILMILFFLVIPFSLANTDYNETGNNNKYFMGGTGFFNTAVDDQSFTRTITTGRQAPLVTDLDGDGTNEIIIFDDDTFRLYQNKELNLLGFEYQLTDPPGGPKYSNFITFDIDGDGKTEIIIAQGNDNPNVPYGELFILEYNGTTFTNQNIINLTGPGHSWNNNDGDIILGCRGVNSCLMIYAEAEGTGAGGTNDVSAKKFNSTNVTEFATTIDTATASTDTQCAPKIKEMAVADYDKDSTNEFISSWLEIADGAGDEELNIYYMDILDNGTVSEEMQITESSFTFDAISSTVANCLTDNAGQYITPPLVADINPGGELETVVGLSQSSSSYKIFSYRGDGSFLDDYPETLNSDGVIISNVILGTFLTDTNPNTDFCVIGMNSTVGLGNTPVLQLTCASETRTQLLQPETEQFDFTVQTLSTPYNITANGNYYSNMMHSVQMSTETTPGTGSNSGGINLHEVLLTYGVFSLNYEGANSLINIYENPHGEAAIIPVDAEKVQYEGGREDLVLVSGSAIYYLDDSFTNSGPTISSLETNPCTTDSTIKLNTTVELTFTISDADGDTVGARVRPYSGSSNQFDAITTNTDGFSANFSTPHNFLVQFEANKTVGTGTISIEYRDSGSQTIETQELTFSVGNSGAQFGDSSCGITTTDETSSGNSEGDQAVNASLDANKQDNVIRNAILDIEEQTGFNLGLTGIWLFVMAVVGYALVGEMTARRTNGGSIVTSILFIEAILLILGVKLGFISAALLIIIMILAVAIVAVGIRWHFMGSRG